MVLVQLTLPSVCMISRAPGISSSLHHQWFPVVVLIFKNLNERTVHGQHTFPTLNRATHTLLHLFVFSFSLPTPKSWCFAGIHALHALSTRSKQHPTFQKTEHYQEQQTVPIRCKTVTYNLFFFWLRTPHPVLVNPDLSQTRTRSR